MRILTLARNRRSVRKFSSDLISNGDLFYILDAARHAPSGANRQPWIFIIVRDFKTKQLVREICEKIEKRFYSRAPKWFINWASSRGISWVKSFLTEAPILIFVFSNSNMLYYIESTWLMIGYLILAAEELGYSTLTYTPSDVRWANKLLNVPNKYKLQCIIPVGKAREKPSYPGRKDLREIVYFELYKNDINNI